MELQNIPSFKKGDKRTNEQMDEQMFGRIDELMNRRRNERKHGVTWSLLKLLNAAKKRES